MERLSETDYKTKEGFKKIFTQIAKVPKDVMLCGNVRVCFVDDAAKLGGASRELPGSVSSYEQISSPLALYRAISVFECGVSSKEQDFYKTNWHVLLQHKPSGKYLMLGEWKGGFQIFTDGISVDKLPKKFIKDVEAFLTWFVSNKVPIGYDGVVAGSVA